MYRLVGIGSTSPLPVTTDELQSLLRESNYDQFKAAGAKMNAADRQMVLDNAIRALPSCYGERLSNCIHGHWEAPLMINSSDCLTIASGYVADFDKFDVAVEAVPFCDETRIPRSVGYIAVGAGFALGVLFGAMLS